MGFKFRTEPRFRVGSPYQSLAIRAFRKWAIERMKNMASKLVMTLPGLHCARSTATDLYN